MKLKDAMKIGIGDTIVLKRDFEIHTVVNITGAEALGGLKTVPGIIAEDGNTYPYMAIYARIASARDIYEDIYDDEYDFDETAYNAGKRKKPIVVSTAHTPGVRNQPKTAPP